MPGRTLDAMVYAFYGLIENAILRSNVAIQNLTVNVKLAIRDRRFTATVSNNIQKETITQADMDKIEQVRSAVNSRDSARLAQSEGLSGLHKVWLAANGPHFSAPLLNFGINEDHFEVQLEFNITASQK